MSQTQPEPAVMVALTVGAVCGLLVLALLRRVPAEHVAVVTRHGLVVQVVPPGWWLRAPGQGFVLLPTDADVALRVAARTRDGTAVRMLVDASATMARPTTGEPFVDPVDLAYHAAEDALADVVGSVRLDELAPHLLGSWEACRSAVDRAAGPFGMRVTSMTLVRLEVIPGPGAARSAARARHRWDRRCVHHHGRVETPARDRRPAAAQEYPARRSS